MPKRVSGKLVSACRCVRRRRFMTLVVVAVSTHQIQVKTVEFLLPKLQARNWIYEEREYAFFVFVFVSSTSSRKINK